MVVYEVGTAIGQRKVQISNLLISLPDMWTRFHMTNVEAVAGPEGLHIRYKELPKRDKI